MNGLPCYAILQHYHQGMVFDFFSFWRFRFVNELGINLGLGELEGDLLRTFKRAHADTVSVAAPVRLLAGVLDGESIGALLAAACDNDSVVGPEGATVTRRWQANLFVCISNDKG